MSAKTFEEWALFMHETYERLAPSLGYETRTDTRAFDPESANGRLMIACVAELLNSSRASLLADAPEVEGLVKELREVGWYAESQIDDIIDALLSQAARIKALEEEIAKLKGAVKAMLHDLETSEGLMCCDNSEGQSLFELKHQSAEAYRRDYPEGT